MSDPRPILPEPTSADGMAAFCPGCWSPVPFSKTTCLRCGVSIAALSEGAYAEKLERALRQPVGEVREQAARLLGAVGGPEVRAALFGLARQEADTYLAAAALEGLAGLESRFPELPRTDWKSFTGPEYPLLVRVAALEALRSGGRP
jgi:hypothetical protein